MSTGIGIEWIHLLTLQLVFANLLMIKGDDTSIVLNLILEHALMKVFLDACLNAICKYASI